MGHEMNLKFLVRQKSGASARASESPIRGAWVCRSPRAGETGRVLPESGFRTFSSEWAHVEGVCRSELSSYQAREVCKKADWINERMGMHDHRRCMRQL